jgi:hypothetical protein
MAGATTKARAKTKKAKKTVKKTAARQQAAAKPVQAKGVWLGVDSLHKLTIVVSLALAGLAAALMSPVILPMTVSYLTKDVLLSVISTVFVPAERILWEVDLRWALIGLLLLGAFYSLALLSRWRTVYDKALQGRVWHWRWAYLALALGLLVAMVAALTGIYDWFTLKLIGALTAAGFGFAWLSERQNEKGRGRAVAAYWLGLASVLLPWKFIVCHALFTTLYGLERLPWHAYAAQAVVLLGLILIFVNLRLSNVRSRRLPDYPAAERNYLAVTLLTQVAFATILIVGFAEPGA